MVYALFYSLLLVSCCVGATTPNKTLRIFNGEDVSSGEIPFIVRLRIFSNLTPGYYYVCGGSLLSENWVVTAAHCVMDNAQYKGANHTHVTHGTNILATAGDIFTDTSDTGEVRKRATQVFVHENYNSWFLQNDLAMLYFEDGFAFGDKISSVGVGVNRPATGDTVTVAGWGLMEDSNLATQLQSTTYSVPDQGVCVEHYWSSGYRLLPGMWCTGNSNMTTHSATGDSGGPVFQQNSDGSSHLYGLVSWGVDVSDIGDDDYDVNTDMVYHSSWVAKIMNEGLDVYRKSLTAQHGSVQSQSWSSGTDVLRYQVYLLSCEPGQHINLTLTHVQLASDDYSHVLIRDGGEYNSPVIHQQHTSQSSATTLVSSTNSLQLLIRTTSDTDDKVLEFQYTAVLDPGSGEEGCGVYMKVCSNNWECYDPEYACDTIPDCSDKSDEMSCGAFILWPSNSSIYYAIFILALLF